MGSFYRPPNGNANIQLSELEKTLHYISNKTRNNPNHTVEENWIFLKLFISQSMASHIPSKTTSRRHNLPWLSSETKRRCRKKHRMYRKAKKSDSPAAMAAFKTF